MSTVNIHKAKTHLSRLIDEVATGKKDVIIAKAGKPVARLSAIKSAKPKRKFGLLKGKIKIAANFDAPLPKKVLAAFESRR